MPRTESSLFPLRQTRFFSRPHFCRGSPCLPVSLNAFSSPSIQILPGLLNGLPVGLPDSSLWLPSHPPCCHRVNLTKAHTHLLFNSPGGFSREKPHPLAWHVRVLKICSCLLLPRLVSQHGPHQTSHSRLLRDHILPIPWPLGAFPPSLA